MIVGYWVKNLIFQSPTHAATTSTQYRVTLTKNEIERTKLAPFFERLTQDGYAIEPLSSKKTTSSFYNCQTDEEYLFSGSGVEGFYFKRAVPINALGGKVYPDFVITLFTFSSPEEAILYRDKIIASHHYHRANEKCSWNKMAWTIEANGQWVFYFIASADMLRDFTEKYRLFVQKMNL